MMTKLALNESDLLARKLAINNAVTLTLLMCISFVSSMFGESL